MNREKPDEPEEFLEKALSAAFRRSKGGRSVEIAGAATARAEKRDPDEVTPPERLGRYPVSRILGCGGMGIVYRIADPELDRDLAIKVLRRAFAQDADITRRFLEEARICSRLQHPGIIPIHELGRLEDGRPYFTMKIVEGQTLAELIRARREENPEIPRFLEIYEKLSQTLAYAHEQGISHGDVKPHNVMVGSFGEIQLMDWGFARDRFAKGHDPSGETPAAPQALPTTSSETARAPKGDSSRAWGTPAYMAPEQARGEAPSMSTAVDVFGLGAVLCEILTGSPPYTGVSRSEVLLKASRGWLDDARARLESSSSDPDLVDLALRCLAPDPAHRPPHAGIVARAVEDYRVRLEERARKSELEAAEARAVASQERRTRRLTVALAASILAAVLIVTVGGAIYLEQRRQRVEELREAVDDAMQRALILRAEARAAPEYQRARWEEALGAARQAEAFARTREADSALIGEARDLLRDMEAERAELERNQQMARLLETVRPHLGDERSPEQLEVEYGDAFRAFGLDVDHEPVEQVASRIRESSIRSSLLGALDDWSHVRRDASLPDLGSWRVLVEIALQADSDPWRTEMRRAYLASDRARLLELAESEEASNASPESLDLLARCLVEMGATGEAIELLRKASRQYPEDFWISHNLASQLGTLGPPPLEEIVRVLWMTVAVRPDGAHAWVDLGRALAMQGHMDDAAAALDRAVSLEPDDGRAHLLIGVIAETRGDLVAATEAYERSVRGGQRWAYVNLAGVLHKRGYLDDAVAMAAKAVELLPGDAELLSNYGSHLYYQNLLEEDLNIQDRALALSPELPFAQCNYGLCLLELGRFDEALEWLRRGHEAAQRSAEDWPHPSAGWIAEAESRIAMASWIRRIDTSPTIPSTPEDCALVAQVAFCMGLDRTALRFHARTLEIDPDYPEKSPPGFLFEAARAAVRWSLGESELPEGEVPRADRERPDAEECREWLERARGWLERELSGWDRRIESGAASLDEARGALSAWPHTPLLGPLLQGAFPQQFPPEEREVWQTLGERFQAQLSRCLDGGWRVLSR